MLKHANISMTWFLSAAVLFCAMRGTALSQQAVATNAPKIACDMPIFNFGEQDDTLPVTHEYTIRNDGRADLVIHNVKTSCGCTVATPSSSLLAPGERTTVKVTLNLHGRRGAQSKAISVECNDPAQPNYVLYLNGTAVSELYLDPTYVTFSSLSVSSNVSREIRFFARKPETHVTNVMCDSPYFRTELIPQLPGAPPTIKVSTVPPLPSGQTRSTLHVYTDHPLRQEVQATLLAIVPPEVRVLPDEINVRGQRGGPAPHTALLLIPGTVRDYKVLSVEAPFPATHTQFRLTAPGTYRIEITDLPVGPEIDGKKILIRTSLNLMREISVPLHFIPEAP